MDVLQDAIMRENALSEDNKHILARTSKEVDASGRQSTPAGTMAIADDDKIPKDSSSTVSLGSIDHVTRERFEADPAFHVSPEEVSTAANDFVNAIQLGRQLEKEGRYQDAVLSFRQALLQKNKTITFDSPAVQAEYASVLFDVGMIHANTKHQDPSKALEAFELCLDLSRTCLGSEHPSVARVLYETGVIYEVMDEPAEAMCLFLDAIAILQSNSMRGLLKEIWKSLSRVQVSLGQSDEATSSFNEAEKL
jgi:hypothetical protein